MVRRSKYTIEFEKKYSNKIPDFKKSTLSKYFKIKKSLLQDVYNRGVGAFHSNRSAVRKGVNSPEQWAQPRTYKFILNVVKYRKGEKVPMSAGSDFDLIKKA